MQELVRQLTFFRVLEKGIPEPQVADELFSGEWDSFVVDFMKSPEVGLLPKKIEWLSCMVDSVIDLR